MAMCEKAQKMEAELRQSKSHAINFEEELFQMRRERFVRPLRPITAVDRTRQTSVKLRADFEASAEFGRVRTDVGQHRPSSTKLGRRIPPALADVHLLFIFAHFCSHAVSFFRFWSEIAKPNGPPLGGRQWSSFCRNGHAR